MTRRMVRRLLVAAALACSWGAPARAGGMSPGEGRTVDGAGKEVGEVGNDARITARIKTHIFNTDALNGSDITVDTENRVVTLGGTVPSEKGRQRVVELARATEGVERVVDHLRIGRF